MGKSVNLTRVVDGDGGIGYQAGRGGAVTQATSKSTDVTLNKPSGRITLNGAALAAGATASFTLNNTSIAETDTVAISLSGAMGTFVNYNIWNYVGGGYVLIAIKNISGGSLSDAPTINFAVIKGASA
jgi:hypothetical protein